MPENTEREKELLVYIEKLVKYHSLLITTYTEIVNLYAGMQYLLNFLTENLTKIDPLGTNKNMFEVLNREFGADYKITNIKEELDKDKAERKQ
jgi:hypothetical protein